jgi:fatty acid desaturase
LQPDDEDEDPEDRPADRALVAAAITLWLIAFLVLCCGLWWLDLPACWLGC